MELRMGPPWSNSQERRGLRCVAFGDVVPADRGRVVLRMPARVRAIMGALLQVPATMSKRT